MENQTPKHFVLQLGSLISLYISLGFLLGLLFGIINLKFPDATEGYWAIESASSAVRLGIAMVVVFFPTYLVLTRLVNKLRRKEQNSSYLNLTKWLVYLSLLVGGGVLLGDLVAVIMMFLEGDVTQRFIFKALAVLVVVGMAFHYYILDARGYWLKNESKSVMYGYGALLAVFMIVALGFSYIETPAQVREMKLDETQISDLQSIQWKVEEVLTMSSSTPANLEELYGEFDAPTAPEGRPGYIYERTDTGFKLCATFSRDSIQPENEFTPSYDNGMKIKNPDNWAYKGGEYCFDRVIK
ncbi:hypothetical protein K2P47_00350 [Patescibacteria group bacterium]|nr:hypothetical protein [Patescibacteria group bacterium]